MRRTFWLGLLGKNNWNMYSHSENDGKLHPKHPCQLASLGTISLPTPMSAGKLSLPLDRKTNKQTDNINIGENKCLSKICSAALAFVDKISE